MGDYVEAMFSQAGITEMRVEKTAALTKPLPNSPSQETEDRGSLKDRMRSTFSPKRETTAVFPQTARPDLNKPIPQLPFSPPSPNTPPKTSSGVHHAQTFAVGYRQRSSAVPGPLHPRKPIPTYTDSFGPEIQHVHARSHSDPNSEMSSIERRNSFSAKVIDRLDEDVPPIPAMCTTLHRFPPRPPHSTLRSTIPTPFYRKPPLPPIPPRPIRSTFPRASRKPGPLRSSSDFPSTSTTHAFTHVPLPYRDVHYSHPAYSSTSSSWYSDHPREEILGQHSLRSRSPSKRETGHEKHHQKKSSLNIITPVEDENEKELPVTPPYGEAQKSHSAQSSTSSRYSDRLQNKTQAQSRSRSGSPTKNEAKYGQRYQKKIALHVITQFENGNGKDLLKCSSSVYSNSPTIHNHEEPVIMSGRLSTPFFSADLPMTVPRSEKGDSPVSDNAHDMSSNSPIHKKPDIAPTESTAVSEAPSPISKESGSPREMKTKPEQNIYGIEVPTQNSQGIPEKSVLDGFPGVPGTGWEPPSQKPPLDANGEPIAMTRDEDFQSRTELIKARMRWYNENVEAKHKWLLVEEERMSAFEFGKALLRTTGLKKR